jgi:excisionase family DNA binding protein
VRHIKVPNKLAFSISELAELASVGRSFIYEEIKSGRLKLKKAGRRSLILCDEAKAWLEAMPNSATKAKKTSSDANL